MMRIQEFVQIAFIICLLLLPAVILASLVRLPPIYQLAQRKRSMRPVIVLGNGLLCFGFTYLTLIWLTSLIVYSVAEFYFDTTLGFVAGITRANIGQFKWAVINEMWLRQVIPAGLIHKCLSGNTTTCQLADMANKISSPGSMLFILLALALVCTLVNLLLSWRYLRPQDGSKAG